MNQPLKALISARAKKFIANHLLQTFTSKERNNSQCVFPTTIGCHPWPPFVYRRLRKKRWPRVTKPIVVGKTHCELLRSFEVKVCNKWLAMNFLALADIKALSG